MKILYEDRWIAVAVKPSGLLSEPDGRGGGMPELLAEELGGEIYNVHRLDRAVSGVMLFSRDRNVTGKLTAAVAERAVEKEYLAVLTGVPAEKAAVLEDLLFRDAAINKSYVVKRERKGVRRARLSYELLDTAVDETGTLSLVKVHLDTGRTHQIRVQFASRGLPILGDGRYGSRDRRCEVALFSHALGFRHPVTGKTLRFSDEPEGWPWSLFSVSALTQKNE